MIRSMWPQKLVNTSQAGPFCFGAYLLVCLVDGHRFCLGERYSMWLDKSSNHHPQREHAGHSCFQGCCSDLFELCDYYVELFCVGH